MAVEIIDATVIIAATSHGNIGAWRSLVAH